MRTIRILFVNSAAQVVGRLFQSVTGALIYIIVARSLGTSGFGEFTIMVTYAALFYIAADFGFNAIVLRESGGEDSKVKLGFQELLGLRFIYGFILVAIASLILIFFPYSLTLKVAMIVTLFTVVTQALLNTANLIFQYKLRYDLAAAAIAVEALSNLGIIYLLSRSTLSILGIAGSYVLAGIAMVVVAFGLARTLVRDIRPRFDFVKYREIFWKTLPVGLTLIFNLVYFRADTFILSFYKSSADVGIYGAAYKFFEFALVFPTFFMNSLYPMLITHYRLDRDKFRQYVRWTLIALAGLSTAGTVFSIVIAPWLVEIVFGPRFSEAVLPFQILIASAPVFFLSNLYMWLMLILRRQKAMALVYALGMVLNIALNLYFIPQYSYLAAAVITGISEVVILLLTVYLSRDWSSLDKQSERIRS